MFILLNINIFIYVIFITLYFSILYCIIDFETKCNILTKMNHLKIIVLIFEFIKKVFLLISKLLFIINYYY